MITFHTPQGWPERKDEVIDVKPLTQSDTRMHRIPLTIVSLELGCSVVCRDPLCRGWKLAVSRLDLACSPVLFDLDGVCLFFYLIAIIKN